MVRCSVGRIASSRALRGVQWSVHTINFSGQC